MVRYLYYPGEVEGDQRRRATDPIWSLDVYRIDHIVESKDALRPTLYYLEGKGGRSFVREELQVVDE